MGQKVNKFGRVLGLILALSLAARIGQAQDFHITQRINAHGDEYTSLAATSDNRFLVIGTEKGDLLIWDTQEKRILKQLHQESPVHAVQALAGSHSVIAAGGPHAGSRQFGVVRKWNIDDGSFVEFREAGPRTITSLAADAASGIVVAAAAEGRLTSWNAGSGELLNSVDLKQGIAGLSLVGRALAISVIKIEDVLRAAARGAGAASSSILLLSADQLTSNPRRIVPENSGRIWEEVNLSPNGALLAASYADRAGRHVSVLDLTKATEVATVQGLKAAWTGDRGLIVFGGKAPLESVTIAPTGEVSQSTLVEFSGWHASGSPDAMSGKVVSSDGTLVWEVFQVNAALAQCDLQQKSCAVLHRVQGMLYALDVPEGVGGGLLVTGGDDGFVRVWKQADFSPAREFQVSAGVPQGVALMPDGLHVVFSSSSRDAPTVIVSGDLSTGTTRTLATIPAPFVRVVRASGGFLYNDGARIVLSNATGEKLREFTADAAVKVFSVSSNGEWLAVVDENGTLYGFEIKTGRQVAKSRESLRDVRNVAIGNDGQAVYTTESGGSVKRWETRGNSLKEIARARGNSQSLQLSSDGKRLAIGGNHRDVSIFESTGKDVAYFQTSSSDFYVTNAWVSGKRLIFSTDMGVLFGGTIGN